MKLYKYSGTIEELAVERGRISYIKLFDVTDFDKAPTRLEVFGALGKDVLTEKIAAALSGFTDPP